MSGPNETLDLLRTNNTDLLYALKNGVNPGVFDQIKPNTK